MDQLNGLFAFISISAKIAAFVLPVPVASFTGNRTCTVIDLFGRLYLSGASTWSAYIGLYRVLYIKAQVVEGQTRQILLVLLAQVRDFFGGCG